MHEEYIFLNIVIIYTIIKICNKHEIGLEVLEGLQIMTKSLINEYSEKVSILYFSTRAICKV